MAKQTPMRDVWTQDKLDLLADVAGVDNEKINLAITRDPASDYIVVIGASRPEEKRLKQVVTAALARPAFADAPVTEVKGDFTNTAARHYTRNSEDVKVWSRHKDTLAADAGVEPSLIRVETAMIDGNRKAVICVAGTTAADERDNLHKVLKPANTMVIEEQMPRPNFVPCSQLAPKALVAA